MGDEPTDPLPALRACFDQAACVAPEIAVYARAVFDAFKAEGFDSKQALYLTAVQLQSSPGSPG